MDKYYGLTQCPFLLSQDIAEIIWAAETIKPVSQLQFITTVAEQDVQRLVATIARYGLLADYRVVEFEETSIQLLSIARAQESISQLLVLNNQRQHLSKQEMWRRYGTLFGYPETAIDGFVRERRVQEECVLQNELSIEELRVFFATRPFRLSQDHWREEVSTVKRWIGTLKRAAPETYLHIERSE